MRFIRQTVTVLVLLAISISAAVSQKVCPSVSCPRIFIPRRCRTYEVYSFEGKTCRGCLKWKAACRGHPRFNQQQTNSVDIGKNADVTVPTSNGESQCPVLGCPFIFIPEECRVYSKFEVNGRLCNGCPEWKKGCVPEKNVNSGNVPPPPSIDAPSVSCPVQTCPRILIPPECREVNTFIFKGKMCEGCPKWIDGCIPNDNNIPGPTNVPYTDCPLQECPLLAIPPECREIKTFQYNEKTCEMCPTWREGCIPDKPQTDSTTIPINQTDSSIDLPVNPADSPVNPEVSCPTLACPLIEIPPECKHVPTFNYLGQVCQKCPVWKKECLLNGPASPVPPPIPIDSLPIPEVACPLLVCPDIPNVPPECIEETTYTFMGKTCPKCPEQKKGCIAGPSPDTFNPSNFQPEMSCPLLSCPPIVIPNECREIPVYEFRGKVCQRCPIWRTGCVLQGNNDLKPEFGDLATNNGPTASPPPILPEISCPLLPCPLVTIPSECAEIPTYEYRGKICNKCPIWRDGCVQNATKISESQLNTTATVSSVTNLEPIVSCPLLACTLINIPDECRDVPTYQFRGRTCLKCPVWRDGCVQNETKIWETQQNTTATVDSTVDKFTNVGPVVSCPLLACTLINIPDECRDVPTYQFRGRTCLKCPVWREGCMQNETKIWETQQNTTVTVDSTVDNFTNVEPVVSCPLLACTLINIPDECRAVPTYQFQGRTCLKCPVWREGCTTTNQTTLSINVTISTNETATSETEANVACPLENCSKTDIPIECQDIPTYQYKGLTCQKCPVWREGCMPFEPVSCPVLSCPVSVIPDECQDNPTYTYRGKTCSKCPIWREGCGSQGVTGIPIIPIVACPLQKCTKMLIPPECEEVPTYQFRGVTCKKCPEWRKGCVPKESGSDFVACPLQKCPAIFIPKECIEDSTFIFMGKKCKKCPTWKKGCVQANVTTETKIDISSDRRRIPQMACPLLHCPRMHDIPKECREIPTMIVDGRECTMCPKHREGCVASSVDKLISTTSLKECPDLICTQQFIPGECREYPTSEINGEKCLLCPVWKTGCTDLKSTQLETSNSGNNGLSIDKCHGLVCSLEFIPSECREYPVITFRGKKCLGCPEWSTACGRQSVNFPYEKCEGLACTREYIPPECRYYPLIEHRGKKCIGCQAWKQSCRDDPLIATTEPTPTTLAPIVTTQPEVLCPDKPCSKIFIPAECRETPTYTYKGKICDDCPRWKDSCKQHSSSHDHQNNQSVDRNRFHMTGGNEIDPMCPILPCPPWFIPAECKQMNYYEHNGVMCEGCATWKDSCAIPYDRNMNGLLAQLMFSSMFAKK